MDTVKNTFEPNVVNDLVSTPYRGSLLLCWLRQSPSIRRSAFSMMFAAWSATFVTMSAFNTSAASFIQLSLYHHTTIFARRHDYMLVHKHKQVLYLLNKLSAAMVTLTSTITIIIQPKRCIIATVYRLMLATSATKYWICIICLTQTILMWLLSQKHCLHTTLRTH